MIAVEAQSLSHFITVQLHIDSHHGPSSPEHKDKDFFKEVETDLPQPNFSIPINGSNGNAVNNSGESRSWEGGREGAESFCYGLKPMS